MSELVRFDKRRDRSTPYWVVKNCGLCPNNCDHIYIESTDILDLNPCKLYKRPKCDQLVYCGAPDWNKTNR
jgi:hypothetical protein